VHITELRQFINNLRVDAGLTAAVFADTNLPGVTMKPTHILQLRTALGEEAGTRRSLRRYSASYLRFVWSLSAGVTCTTYSLWAFELRRVRDGIPWETISIAPFVIALLRYAMDVDSGRAGSPEDVVLGDRVLLGLGLVWALVFGAGVLTR